MNGSTVEQIERLCAELKAIELWNVAFRRKEEPEENEKIAFLLRKKRRREVIRQMAVLTRGRCAAHISNRTGTEKSLLT
jgi:hypothetical protein